MVAETPPIVSVVIPTFGRPRYLSEAIASVLAQTETTFECIVVDDSSPDPVQISVLDPRLRLIRHIENRGVAAARNTGLRAARGDYVTFLDDDDLWAPTRLEEALVVAGPSVVVACGLGRVGSPRVDKPRLIEPLRDTILEGSPPHLGSVLVPRAICPWFDESYEACEDLDWWLRLAPLVRPLVTEDAGWQWRQHDGPRGRVGVEARIAGSVKLLDQHADYFARRPAARAYRWIRIGWLARAAQQPTLVRHSAWEAVSAHPRARTVARCVRMLVGK